MATYFGATPLASASAIAANYCYAIKATCGLTGNITTARIWAKSAGTFAVFAIYSVVGGNPSVRLGYSDPVNININTYQLWNFPFTTPVAVVNGTQYAIAVLMNNGSASVACDFGSGTYYYNANTYPTPEAPFAVDGSATGLWYFEAGVDAAGGGSTFIPKVVII